MMMDGGKSKKKKIIIICQIEVTTLMIYFGHEMKRKRIIVFRSVNKFLVYGLQHYENVIDCQALR